MTFPSFVDLDWFDNIPAAFPFHVSVNTIERHFPVHRHDFMELSLVLEGEGSEAVNGMAHPMKPGTLTFLLPYQAHELFTPPGQKLVLCNCMFAMSFLLGHAGGAALDIQEVLFRESPGEPSYVQLETEEFAAYAALLKELLQEFKSGHPWREVMIKSQLTQVLVLFDRYRKKRRRASGEPVLSAAKEKSGGIWNIMLHIQRHHTEKLSLRDIAARFYISESYLCELLKAHTGKTFVDLLHEIRIRHACAMLVSTALPVSEIAYEVGYNSPKTFFRVFRELKGVSPARFRERLKPMS